MLNKEKSSEHQLWIEATVRLAVVVSHPIQYYTPIFRALAKACNLTVFYGVSATQQHQAQNGFGVEFEWDIDLLSGYKSVFLQNTARNPSPNTFFGCDVPDIGEVLRKNDFDAVLLFGWYQKVLIQTLIAAKRLGVPVLVRGDSHLSTPRNIWKWVLHRICYPLFLRQFDAALFVGSRFKEYMIYHDYPEERLFFSPHCVDNSRFRRQPVPDLGLKLRKQLRVAADTPLVLFAGKLVAFKRPQDVIEAVAQVRKHGIEAEVLIAGSGILEDEVGTRARRLGVPIHLLGFCNQTMMPAVYAAADVLVLPSTGRETWGLVCNEALASGTPIVVSSDVGCAPDLAADGVAGRQYIFGDIEDLADKLVGLLHEPPTPFAAAALAARYDIGSAVEGILSAVSYTRSRNA